MRGFPDLARPKRPRSADQLTLGTVLSTHRHDSISVTETKPASGTLTNAETFHREQTCSRLSLAAALAVQSASAGLHYSSPITVSGTVAYGQVHAARTSGDNKAVHWLRRLRRREYQQHLRSLLGVRCCRSHALLLYLQTQATTCGKRPCP